MNIFSNHRILTGYIILFLLMGALSSSLLAKTSDRSARFQFSCVTWDKGALPELFYRNGKEYVPIELFAGKRSALYPLRRTPEFKLYMHEVDDEGKEAYKLVGKAALPEGTHRVLFFIKSETTPDGLPLTVSGMDDSLKAFPPGSFRFLNLTQVPLLVVLGESTSSVAPRAMTLVKLEFSDEVELLPFYIKTEDDLVLYENRLFAQSDGREMVFIAPPRKGRGRLTIKFLSNTVRPEASDTSEGGSKVGM